MVCAMERNAWSAGEGSSDRQNKRVSSWRAGSLRGIAVTPSPRPVATELGASATTELSEKRSRSQLVWNDSLRILGSNPARRQTSTSASWSRGASSRGKRRNVRSASVASATLPCAERRRLARRGYQYDRLAANGVALDPGPDLRAERDRSVDCPGLQRLDHLCVPHRLAR